MAKEFLDYTGLTLYDQLIKNVICDGDEKNAAAIASCDEHILAMEGSVNSLFKVTNKLRGRVEKILTTLDEGVAIIEELSGDTYYVTSGSPMEDDVHTLVTSSGIYRLVNARTAFIECNDVGRTGDPNIDVDLEGYDIMDGGGYMVAKMSNALHTAEYTYLNINDRGNYRLYFNGQPACETNSWDDGEMVNIWFDGNYYQSTHAFSSRKASELEYADGVSVADKIVALGARMDAWEAAVDDVPTPSSSNMVRSGGIYTYGEGIREEVHNLSSSIGKKDSMRKSWIPSGGYARAMVRVEHPFEPGKTYLIKVTNKVMDVNSNYQGTAMCFTRVYNKNGSTNADENTIVKSAWHTVAAGAEDTFFYNCNETYTTDGKTFPDEQTRAYFDSREGDGADFLMVTNSFHSTGDTQDIAKDGIQGSLTLEVMGEVLMTVTDKIAALDENVSTNSAAIEAISQGAKVTMNLYTGATTTTLSCVYKGEESEFTIKSTLSEVTADNIEIREDSDTGTLIASANTSTTSVKKTYTLTGDKKFFGKAFYNGAKFKANATMSARYSIIYGFGNANDTGGISEVTTNNCSNIIGNGTTTSHRLSARTSATTTYSGTASANSVHFYILVPKDINNGNLSTFTMGGAPYVMDNKSVEINGVSYKMYRSGAIYNSGASVSIAAS